MFSKKSKKYIALAKQISGYKKTAVGLSGGTDSTFLVYIAQSILGRENCLAVTIVSEFISPDELESVKKIVKKYNFNHEFIHLKASKTLMKDNPPDRCYHCKKKNYTAIKALARRRKIFTILDGTNADDDPEERPGHKAVDELDVKTPLKDCGITKADIRELSKQLGLTTWNKLPNPCLATRFPYNSPIDSKGLIMVDDAERFLKKLGLKLFRVRYHQELARIQAGAVELKKISAPSLRSKIDSELRKIGFKYVTIDCCEYGK